MIAVMKQFDRTNLLQYHVRDMGPHRVRGNGYYNFAEQSTEITK